MSGARPPTGRPCARASGARSAPSGRTALSTRRDWRPTHRKIGNFPASSRWLPGYRCGPMGIARTWARRVFETRLKLHHSARLTGSRSAAREPPTGANRASACARFAPSLGSTHRIASRVSSSQARKRTFARSHPCRKAPGPMPQPLGSAARANCPSSRLNRCQSSTNGTCPVAAYSDILLPGQCSWIAPAIAGRTTGSAAP